MAKDTQFQVRGSYYPRHPERDPAGINSRVDFIMHRIRKVRTLGNGKDYDLSSEKLVYVGTSRELPENLVEDIRQYMKQAIDNYLGKKWSYPLILKELEAVEEEHD